MLPTEILIEIASNLDASNPEGASILRKRATASTALYLPVTAVLYRHLEVRAETTADRSHQAIGLQVRALLLNPDMCLNVEILDFKIRARSARARKSNFSTFCKLNLFFNDQDRELCRSFVASICKLPNWSDHPGGKWLPDYESRSNVLSDTASQSWVSGFMDWMKALKKGRLDAWVALMLALCRNGKELYVDAYHELYWPDTAVLDEDPNWVSRVLRAGGKSQRKEGTIRKRRNAGIPGPHEDFEGILRFVHTVRLAEAPERLQSTNKVFPLLALPKMRRVELSILGGGDLADAG